MPLIPADENTRSVVDLLQRRTASPAREAVNEPYPYPFDRALADILRARRSVRTFSNAPVPVARVKEVIKAARACEASVWGREAGTEPALCFLVTANRVTGLAPGVYVAPGFDEAPLLPEDALDGLNKRYANGAALLHVCGRISADYAQVLTQAGTLGYAAWLSAISAGLAGSVYGGTSAQITTAARRIRPDLRHLFTTAIGAEP
jgi:hypothetical protein